MWLEGHQSAHLNMIGALQEKILRLSKHSRAMVWLGHGETKKTHHVIRRATLATPITLTSSANLKSHHDLTSPNIISMKYLRKQSYLYKQKNCDNLCKSSPTKQSDQGIEKCSH